MQQKLTKKQETELWNKLVSEIQEDIYEFERALKEGRVTRVGAKTKRGRGRPKKEVLSEGEQN